MKTPRQIAVELLNQMEKEHAWSNIVLDHALRRSDLSLQDKAFTSALFYGTLTRKYTLDACISAHSKRPISKMDATIKNILRTGMYQLLYMDSVPDHAAVDESVNLCKTMKKASASGFANAIMRSFLRADKKIPVPKKGSLSEKFAVEYSCPPQLAELFLSVYGEKDTRKILENSLEIPETFIRVNTSKINADDLIELFAKKDVKAEKVDNINNCLRITQGSALQNMDEYKNGLFHMQDISSQRAALSVSAEEGQRVMDCCAAPGGKTFILSQIVGENGEVFASDLYQRRVDEMNRRKNILGLNNIMSRTLDMTKYYPELGEFDRVICDAPCSGYGTIRRNPEIKYQKPQEFLELPKLQLKLLSNAAKYCKKDGLLVYSTCTLSPYENGEVVAKFLKSNSEFEVTDKENPLGKTILLGDMGGDGFFYAVLRRV